MKVYSNIYDIDGDIIRKAGDTHRFTVEEAQEKIKHYIEKLKGLYKLNEEVDVIGFKTKVAAYNNYIDNLANYAIHERMIRGDFNKKKNDE